MRMVHAALYLAKQCSNPAPATKSNERRAPAYAPPTAGPFAFGIPACKSSTIFPSSSIVVPCSRLVHTSIILPYRLKVGLTRSRLAKTAARF
jgi:hypothetical protein